MSVTGKQCSRVAQRRKVPTCSCDSALSGDDHALFVLAMSKGGKILVPADKIAYVEFGAPEARRVGFGNIA